jgi:phosphate transport system substrate-binding protein
VKFQRYGILAAIALTATLAVAACGSDNPTTPGGGGATGTATGNANCASGTLSAAGSTAQKNAMAEWVKGYSTQCSGATINYNANGSGAGIQAFIANTADFAGSDSALKDPTEQTPANDRCKGGPAIHLPMVIGPIGVAYNLNGVSDLQLKPATLAKIFAGKVTKWDAPEIKADNPNANLPSSSILTIHRSDSSGTTDNFTNYLSAAAASDWTFAHDKVWKAPGGQGAQGSDGVTAAIKSGTGSIGYIEWSFAQINSMSLAKIQNGAGEWAALTADSAGKTISSAQVTGTGDDLKLKIDYNTKEAGAYPIVLVTYEIVCSKGNPSGKVALLKGFLTYAAGDGQAKLTSLGYAPLPDSVRSKVQAAIGSLG